MLKTIPFNIFIILLLLKSSALWAATDGINSYLNPLSSDSVFSPNTSAVRVDIEGENIDLHSGALSWLIKDISMPGQAGMDIVVERTFGNNDTPINLFGSWDLSIPRISIPTPTIARSNGVINGTGICADASMPPTETGVTGLLRFDGADMAGGINLYLQGGEKKQVYKKNPILTQYPADTKYVTKDNWIIKCFDPGTGKQDGFIALSPNGLKYTFDKSTTWTGTPLDNREPGVIVVYVSKIEDLYGNYLEYKYDASYGMTADYMHGVLNSLTSNNFEGPCDNEYSGLCNNNWNFSDHKFLSSITSNDGRQVIFNYKAEPLIGVNEGGPRRNTWPVIDNIIANYGNNITRTWNYDYTTTPDIDLNRDSYAYRTSAERMNRLLRRVRKPDGLTWEYKYEALECCSVWTGEVGSPFKAFLKEYYNSISEVKTPYNQIVKYKYEYRSSFDIGETHMSIGYIHSFASNGIVVVKEKSLDDLIIQFSYERMTNNDPTNVDLLFKQTKTTTVTTGELKREVYHFGRFQSETSLAWNKLTIDDHDWKQGLLLKHELFDLQNNSKLVRTIENLWKKSNYMIGVPIAHTLYPSNFENDDPSTTHIGNGDRVTTRTNPNDFSKAILDKVIIDGKYITTYKDHDEYGNPRVIEQSNGIDKKTTRISYKNSINPWLIGLQETETIDGLVGEKRNSFDPVYGSLVYTNEYGVTNAFTYYPKGHQWAGERQDLTTTHNNKLLKTVYSDYFRGIAQKEVRPLNQIINLKVNPTGTIAWEDDAAGNRTMYTYDNKDEVSSISYPQETNSTRAIETISWPAINKKITTRGDRTESTTYDSFQRPTLIETMFYANNQLTRIRSSTNYDKYGQLEFSSLPYYSTMVGSAGLMYEYDAIGRVISITNNVDGSKKSYCYDLECNIGRTENLIEHGYIMTDEEGYETIVNHRSYGNPDIVEVKSVKQQTKKASENNGINKYIETLFTWDPAGKLTGVERDGVVKTFIYNDSQQLWKIIQPEIGEISFTYYSDGKIKTKTLQDLSMTTYQYDDLGRENFVRYPGGYIKSTGYYLNNTIRYIYSTMDNNPIAKVYLYDKLKNIIKESIHHLGSNNIVYDISYNYNSLDELASIVYPSGKSIDFSPDPIGRPTKIGKYITNIDYHPTGHYRSITYANQQKKVVDFNEKLLPWSVTHSEFNVPILDLEYHYTDRGNVKNIFDRTDFDNNISLSYDGANRLITAISSLWGSGDFTYDDNDNILTKFIGDSDLQYYYLPGNILGYIFGSKTLRFDYDARGNMIYDSKKSYSYDYVNNLTSVTDLATGSKINYVYDGSKRLTRSMKGGIRTDHFYSEDYGLLNQYNYETGIMTDYVYLNGELVLKLDECADTDTDTDGFADCLETHLGLDPNNPLDARDDLDGDGISNIVEYKSGTNMYRADTDNDGMEDSYELTHNLDPNYNDAGIDIDGDGLTNLEEFFAGTYPRSSDTDYDGMPDLYELQNGLNPNSGVDADNDIDGDFSSNLNEYLSRTDINNPDTDGDKLLDGIDEHPLFNPGIIKPINNLLFK